MTDNQRIQGINLDTKFLEHSSNDELSSETRIDSYGSYRRNESLENMNVCDFEVNFHSILYQLFPFFWKLIFFHFPKSFYDMKAICNSYENNSS
jgi:hypothetical protein